MALIVNQLTATIGQKRLLDQVSFTAAIGEITLVIGPNGAGKSTLLKRLAGDLSGPGQISFNGQSLLPLTPAVRAQQLAILSQQSSLNFPFTVEEVILLGRIPHQTTHQHNHQVLQAVLVALDISHLTQRLYTQLSGGERQRVQLARVLAQIWDATDQPRLLLLDEPLTALDIQHQRQLLSLLVDLVQQPLAIVMVIHDLPVALEMAQRVVVLHQGRVYAQGAPSEVISAELLQQVFSVAATIEANPLTGKPLISYGAGL